MEKCQVCNKEVKNLGLHIAQAHKCVITTRGYYDKYLKKEGEGVCPVCGKETKFKKFSEGYFECCSIQCSTKNPKRQEKIKKTNLEKYGVTNVFQRPETVKKAQKNSHTPEAIKKQLNTKEKIYGVRSFFQLPEIHKKAIKNAHTKEVEKQRLENFYKTIDKFEEDNNCTRTKKLINKYGQGWLHYKKELDLTILQNGQYSYILNSDINKIAKYASENHSEFSTSKTEKEVVDFIKSIYKKEVIENSRSIIGGKELDIYIPEIKFAIEFNGDYWHSEINKEKDYHIDKTKRCEELDIRLMHIFELEWIEKEKICKSLISSALGIYENKIYARNCEIKEVTSAKAREFLNINHIQGNINSKYRIGLFYKEELVQLITIGQSRFRKDEYELLRMCTKLNTQVVGGFSKLLKYQPYKNLISYVDRSKFSGDGYKKSGWTIVGYTPVSYWYWKQYEGYISRYKAQKHKLKNLLGDKYDSNLTEHENMNLNGFFRIYDCGNYKLRYNR